MTVPEVTARVQEIGNIGNNDPEVAHSKEDRLFIDVLREIGKNKTREGRLARAALATQKIDFPRWCA